MSKLRLIFKPLLDSIMVGQHISLKNGGRSAKQQFLEMVDRRKLCPEVCCTRAKVMEAGKITDEYKFVLKLDGFTYAEEVECLSYLRIGQE